MNANLIPPKEKKLRNLRKVLWIVFAAISIIILLVGSLSLPAALLIKQSTDFGSLFLGETGMILLTLLALALVKILATGLVCILIYVIFKYRLDKDDDLFL